MAMVQIGHYISDSLFLGFVIGIPLYGACRRVRVFDVFVDGARESIPIMVKVFPYLLAMIVAIGMFRASGGFELISGLLSPLLGWIGMPTEVFPMALMRPFSGSASNSLLVDIIQHYGPNSLSSQIAATMTGSTETTFYVLAVYFGVVGVRHTRHAVPVGLLADVVGILSAVWVCRWLLT